MMAAKLVWNLSKYAVINFETSESSKSSDINCHKQLISPSTT